MNVVDDVVAGAGRGVVVHVAGHMVDSSRDVVGDVV